MESNETDETGFSADVWRPRLESLRNSLRPWLIFVMVVGLFSLFAPFRQSFWTRDYLPNIFQQSARNIVLAVGMTFVIMTGGIDLSVGSVLALSGIALALSMKGRVPPWMAFLMAAPIAITIVWMMSKKWRNVVPNIRLYLNVAAFVVVEVILGLAANSGLASGVKVEGAVVVCLLIGLACGLINGVGISMGRVPAFVMTLGMMSAARGLTLYATNGASVPASVPRFMALGRGAPMAVLTLGVVLLGALAIARLRTGRYFLTIGGNEQATRLSGVDVSAYKTIAYMLCGLCAGLGAVLVTAMFGQASTNAATGAELDAIAAVVIGGTNLSGGRGSIIGAMVGALTITVITAGLVLIHVQDTLQQVILGAVIVLTVFVDHARRGRG